MCKRFVWSCAVLLSAFILVPAGLASAYGDNLLAELSTAKGNIRSGNLRVHPGLEVRESYDDNIYNVATNEKEDFITTVTPGLLISLGDRHKLELGYAVGIHSYSKYSTEDFVSQHGRALLDMNFPSGFKVYFKDAYLKTEDPRPEELQLRASHKTNDIDASVGYEFPAEKLSVEALYEMRWLEYDQTANKAFNKVTNTFGAAAYYKVMPKTSVLVEYKYGVTDYYDSTNEATDKDSESHAFNVGLKWDATAKVGGTIKTGYEKIAYDNARDQLGNLYEDKDLWSVEVGLSYKATDRTRLNLSAIRSIEDTEYGGSAVYSRSSNYLNNGVNVGVDHKLTPKLKLGLSAGLQGQEYNKMEATKLQRKDDISEFGVGLDYDIRKWLKAAAKYTYYDNDSDDPTRDEEHNRFFVSLAVAL